MDLEELRTMTRRLSGVEMAALRSDDEVDEDINRSYRDLATRQPWPWSYTSVVAVLTAGTDTVTRPSSIPSIDTIAVDEPNYRRLLGEITLADMDRYPSHRAQQGEPWAWARLTDDEVKIFPTPDANYTLTMRGQKYLVPLTSNTDVPVFDEFFHPILAYSAAAYVMEEESEDDTWVNRYRARIAEYEDRMMRFYLPLLAGQGSQNESE